MTSPLTLARRYTCLFSNEICRLTVLSNEQANDFDYMIFTLLIRSLLAGEGRITIDSRSQESVDTKEVREGSAHILWEASSDRPEV